MNNGQLTSGGCQETSARYLEIFVLIIRHHRKFKCTMLTCGHCQLVFCNYQNYQKTNMILIVLSANCLLFVDIHIVRDIINLVVNCGNRKWLCSSCNGFHIWVIYRPMALCKTAVSPLLTHWIYYRIALNNRYHIIWSYMSHGHVYVFVVLVLYNQGHTSTERRRFNYRNSTYED